MKKIILLLLFVCICHISNAQTALNAGDIAFLGIGTDTPDKYAFILLKAVDPGTSISFTDNTWLNGTTLATNENTSTWTTSTSLPIGTVIVISDGPVVTGGGSATGNLAGLSSDGDQILAYQGASTAPSFIAAISSESFASTCNTTTGGALNNLSCLPNPLVDGVDAISVTTSTTEVDNAYYNGSTMGTVAEILAAINNRSNWVTSETVQTFPSWSFSLPIELFKFRVQIGLNNSTLLSFTTATEKNNDHFAIERSSDGRTFTQIGEVKGAGTSVTPQDYTYTDEKPLRGINFYRLKQVDFDGQFSYSPVVSVVFGKVGNVVLYPTPTTSTMNVRLEEAFQTEANWQIVDLMGRIITEGIFPAEQTDAQIPVGTLSEGNYVLRVTAGQEVITQKFRKIEQ
jgi:Secretion system C-terminal sorting domain